MRQIVLAMAVAVMAFAQNASAQNKVKSLYTETQTLKVEQLQNAELPVQVNRYLFAGYNTLCLPMSLSADQLAQAANDLRVERLAAIRQNGSAVELLFVDCTNEGIEAGVPYLVFSPTKQYLRAKNTEALAITEDIKTVRFNDGQGNQVAFSSGWTMRHSAGFYGIPAKQDKEILESILVSTTSDMSFLPTRCGFNWEEQSATANQLVIVHANKADVTAINAAKVNGTTGETVYDLNGRQVVAPTRKGIYIKNGKKIAQ